MVQEISAMKPRLRHMQERTQRVRVDAKRVRL